MGWPANTALTLSSRQNVQFNTALKQSTQIKKELAALASTGGPPTPAALGSLSASLTSFSRTLDEYHALAKQELVVAKQEKAYERLKNFRTELSEFREQVAALKAEREDAQHLQSRAELLGRRPYATSTPENPYANVGGPERVGGEVPTNRYGSGGAIGGQLSMGSADYTREAHALREQNFLSSTNQALDDYIARVSSHDRFSRGGDEGGRQGPAPQRAIRRMNEWMRKC